jgi:preprotein translocase subunit SecE
VGAKEDVVTDDRIERDEQARADGRDSAPRPATAAARRERRSSAGRAADGPAPDRSGDGRPVARAGVDAKPAGKRPEARISTGTADGKGRPTPAGRRDERVSAPARLIRFLREVVAELRKVIWPTRKELVTYTIVVLVFVSFMVAVVALLDIAFAKGVFWLFG